MVDGSQDKHYQKEYRRQNISGIEEIILALYQRGMTTREWQNRPLEEVYTVVFIDAIYFKVKEGMEAKTKAYT